MDDVRSIIRLGMDHIFPNPRYAMREGLLAYGGDLHPDRLLVAYRRGIFPWYNLGDPILWWSPDPRLLLYPDALKLHRSLRKKLRQKRFKVQLDRRFTEVMRCCATIPRKGQVGSWIVPEMIEAFTQLHLRGFAHSIEVCDEEGALIGGLYGVSIGRAFFGESMFSKKQDGSKIALTYLVALAKAWSFDFIDCQIPTDHLMRLGAVKVDRDRFLDALEASLQEAGVCGSWQPYEAMLEEIDW